MLAPGNGNENSIVEFLKPEMQSDGIEVHDTDVKQQKQRIKIKIIESVFLVAANDVMVALADVSEKDKSEDDRKINVLSKFIYTKNSGWGNDAIKVASNKWISQLAAKDLEKKEKTAVIKSLSVFAEKEKIYHIMVSNDTIQNEDLQNTNSAKWHVTLNVGEVSDDSSTNNKKQIAWKSSTIFISYEKFKMKELLEKQQTNILPSGGFSFVNDDKKYFVFVIQTTETTGINNIVAIFELKGKSNENLELLFDENVKGCNPTFFQWKGELFKTLTGDPKDCSKQIMIFDFNRKIFKGKESPIICLRDFLKDKGNFVNTKIGADEVLLFIQEKQSEGSTKKNVFLWITDGTRVSNVGTIVEDIATDSTFYGSVLYTDGELFALHQKYNTDEGVSFGKEVDNTFSLTRLKAQLEQIKFFLKEWGETNNTVLKLCQDTNEKNIYCTAPPPTDGLVGFLHNTINESADPITWKDEFYYSNATVGKNNAENVKNGFKFTGKSAGAKWPVGKQNESPVYSFTDFGFALLATVKFEKTDSTSDNSLLGIGLSGETKQVGLWCKGEKWVLRVKEKNLEETEKKCELGKEYNVAFVLKKDKAIKVYVNGDQLAGLSGDEKHIKDEDKITHFYFGVNPEGNGNNNDECHVTVTNVLLYNRPFNFEEVINLKTYVKPVEETQTTAKIGDKNTDGNTGGNSDQQTPPSLPPSPSEEKEEKAPSPSRTEDGGVGGGVRVFSLLLAVLCVSAPLLHL